MPAKVPVKKVIFHTWWFSFTDFGALRRRLDQKFTAIYRFNFGSQFYLEQQQHFLKSNSNTSTAGALLIFSCWMQDAAASLLKSPNCLVLSSSGPFTQYRMRHDAV